MDVLTAAWTARGQFRTAGPPAVGSCARCGRDDLNLTAVRAVVSPAFTGYDGWRNPCGAGLCPVCTWGYRTPELRMVAHLVAADPPSLQRLPSTRLTSLLAGSLPPDVAVVVPLRRGRKHLMPTAVWGRITVDDAHLPWTVADTLRLAAMHRLRAHGFRLSVLAEPAPPWSALRRLPSTTRTEAIDDWRTLDPWRSRRPWLELALQASKPPAGAVA